MHEEYSVKYLDLDAGGWVSCTEVSTDLPYIAYKIPHDQYNNHQEDENIRKPGIYFLVGTRKGKNSKPYLYIGKAARRMINGESFRPRLGEHDREGDKSYGKWDYALLVTRTNEDLDERELKYLEATLIDMEKELNLFDFNQRSEQSGKPDTRLNEFIERAKELLFVLGFDLFGMLSDKTQQEEKHAKNETGEKKKEIKEKAIKKNDEIEIVEYHTLTNKLKPNKVKPVEVQINDDKYPVKSWKDVIQQIFDYLYQCDPQKISEIAENGYMLAENGNGNYYVSSNKKIISNMSSTRRIKNTNIYVETQLNAKDLLRFVYNFVVYAGFDASKISIKY